MTVTDIQGRLKDAWSAARAGANAAEQEAGKVISRVASAAGLSPEDVRRQARELGERLTRQRRELEASIDEAVRKTAGRFGFPSRNEVTALSKRLDVMSDRVAELERRTPRAEREAG